MTSLVIGFPDNFESSSTLAILEEEKTAEHEHIWIWDHYYSLVMHRLTDQTIKDKLDQTMSTWASAIAPKLFNTLSELREQNALVLDQSLTLLRSTDQCESFFVIETVAQENSWPAVNVKLPDDAAQTRLAYSVVALAQYFLQHNPLFFRELPLHVLAMRKYYREQKPSSDETSIAEAPAFALQTAMKFFNDMSAGASH